MADARPAGKRGTAFAVVVATGVAGVFGYAIQIIAGGGLSASAYVSFSVFWAATFFVVGALAGLQQESARATHPSPEISGSVATLALTVLLFALGSAFGVAATAPFWATSVFPQDRAVNLLLLCVASAATSGVAVLTGVLYGTQSWRAVSLMIVLDPLLRFVAVGVTLLAARPEFLPLAVVGPLPVMLVASAVLVMRTRVSLDIGRSRFLLNCVRAVGGAASTAILVSALPLFIGAASGAQSAAVGALLFNLTLTRAPIVIPALAFQSLLVVHLRDRAQQIWLITAKLAGAVLGAALLLAAVAGLFVAPWIGAVFGEEYEVSGLLLGALVASAGLTATLAITGAAVLVSHQHTWYLMGWMAAAFVAVVILFVVPLSIDQTSVIALIAGPLVGLVVHTCAIHSRRRSQDSTEDVSQDQP